MALKTCDYDKKKYWNVVENGKKILEHCWKWKKIYLKLFWNEIENETILNQNHKILTQPTQII